MTGDFNHEILEIHKLFEENDLNLKYIHEKIPLYNTENRVQKRERDGWSGIQVVQRCIDGIFFNDECFELVTKLQPCKEFNFLINQEMLTSLQARLSDSPSE